MKLTTSIFFPSFRGLALAVLGMAVFPFDGMEELGF